MGNTLKFYLVTDTHHYAGCFETDSEEARSGQKCLAETGAIIDAAFDLVAADKDINILLVGGDIINNGEMEGHIEMIEKLRKLKASGVKIYLITSTHDYDRVKTKYKNSDKTAAQTERDDLFRLYYEFGPDEAISEEKISGSYAVRPQEGFRLLCLNDDGNGRAFCGYYEETMEWILGHIAEAKAAGERIFAMTHHPVLPTSPIYPVISRRDMLGDWEKVSEILADAGLRYIFTGHTHMHNIAVKETAKGNKIYDINTASLVGYPSAIRKVELDSEKMTVNTVQIADFDWDRQGKTVEEYLKERFDRLLNDIFDSAADDIDRLAVLANGFSVSKETVLKLKTPIKIGGKVLRHLTVGGLGRLIFAHRKIDRSIRKIKLKDIFIEIVRNIYEGDEPHRPGTPVYEAFAVLVRRITPLLRLAKVPDSIFDMLNLVRDGVLYDAPPSDWSAELTNS
ncbi:MAG: metallophosphoesterase [Oscillospiraceae bacterium]|nr:metallophosphoesterase [Oscillospiraceae bacterium]